MATISKIASARAGGKPAYQVRVRRNGYKECATFPTKAEAQAWADEKETQSRQDKHFPHLRAARTTFAALVERYERTVLKDAKAKLRSNQSRQLAWWSKRFAGLTLSRIAPDKIAEARDALLAETFARGKGRKDEKTGATVPPKQYTRSAATANKYLRTLARVFSLAVREWRLIDRNPAAEISKKAEPRGRTRFLSDDERTRLLDECGRSAWPALRALVLLALTTGARRGELIGLRWADVDLKAGADGKAGRALVRESKNGEQRTLPLQGSALKALQELKLHGSARSQYVFPATNGLDEPYEWFDAHWYAALKAAGIEDMRFHDLRHTTASMLAAQGASLLEIADVLGHKTLAMVKRYSHLTAGHKAKVIEKMVTEKGL